MRMHAEVSCTSRESLGIPMARARSVRMDASAVLSRSSAVPPIVSHTVTGAADGATVGTHDGAADGTMLGGVLGMMDGDGVGALVGMEVGTSDGINDGD